VPLNYLFDQQDQTAFYVYPPNNGKGYLQINYSPIPTDLASENSTISVNDIFQTAILDYILYRANSKDAEYAAGVTLAAGYLQTFKPRTNVPKSLGFCKLSTRAICDAKLIPALCPAITA